MLIATSLTSNLQAQQHVIPITAQTNVNTESTQITQHIDQKTNKKRKFTQKTSITRHSKIKKVCLYTGLALGIVGGFLLMAFTMPIMIMTFKVMGYSAEAIVCLMMTGKLS
jgi:hypothetical protein